MVQPELGTAVVHGRLDGYEALVEVVGCATTGIPTGHVIGVKDEAALLALLKEIAEELAGLDWASDDEEFERLCVEAEMDFAEVVRPPIRRKPSSEEDLRRKELGDLGELLALLHALSHLNADPRTTMAKNAIKLYEQISEPGVDVLTFALDLQSDEQHALLPTDQVLLVESKMRTDAGFATMADDAARYFAGIKPHHWQRELLLAQASLGARGAIAASRRVKYFLPIWPCGDPIQRLAFLTSSVNAEEPINLSSLDSVTRSEAAILSIDVDACREVVFAYRRAAEP